MEFNEDYYDHHIMDCDKIIRRNKIRVKDRIHRAEIQAIYSYTVRPLANHIMGKIANIDIDVILDQATLMQDFIYSGDGEDVKVFRKEKKHGFEERYDRDSDFETDTFTSCSTGELPSGAFGPYDVTIETNKGRYIAEYSKYPDEDEYLLPIGTSLKTIAYGKGKAEVLDSDVDSDNDVFQSCEMRR